jgi:hypothetical protein
MKFSSRTILAMAVLAVAKLPPVHADPAPFDLAGPELEVKVTRGASTLPVSQVPNLAGGDRVWIKADLPETQSAHYLLVVAFLRGSTNPPPQSWFFRCETWERKCAAEGLTVTVPPEAQQVLFFLAPATGGDFKTLVNAVRGRPGAFVRATQDLNQATLDRSRLESYLTDIRALNDADPTRIKEAAPLLARSLAIHVDEKCLDRIPQLQAPCLMQGQNSLILNDGHSTSIVEALTTGPASDLAMEASYTPQLSYGYYSPYIASVLDIARILGSFHTAQYQYIPALAAQRGDRVALTLNAAPSFHNPMSVIVAALPAVEQPQLPPLHAVDPKEIYCAKRSSLVLPVEGAPLVFSTGYVHDVTLTLAGKDGRGVALPAKPDAEQGGFVVDTTGLKGATLGDSVHGSLQGFWGFEKYAGPSFQLVNAHAQSWELATSDAGTLIAGREGTVHLQASSVSCVDSIMLKDAAGKQLKAEWKRVRPDEVEVKLPLQQAQPGAVTLLVTQYGAEGSQPVALHAFAEAGRLESFEIHAGESRGLLRGSRLDEVASLTVKGVEFAPGELTSTDGKDQLPMIAQDATAAAALKQGALTKGKVTLKDGRVIDVSASVAEPRPSVTLIGKFVQPSASGVNSNIRLVGQDELPQDAKLTFSIRAQSPASFSRSEKIEVATADESFSTTLSFSDGGITLEDSKVAVATVDPAKALGPSAFGPLQFRIVANGVAGDWQKLATLVRLPVLKGLTCPATPDLACKLSGFNLFLVDSVSNDPQFRHPVEVPDGFPGFALPVPHPVDGQLYVKVRDDPSVINMAALNVQQLAATPDEAARADARHEAAHKDPEITHTDAPRADTPRTDAGHADSPHADVPAGSAATPFAGPPAPAAAAPGSATPASGGPAAGSPAAGPLAPASTTSAGDSPAK